SIEDRPMFHRLWRDISALPAAGGDDPNRRTASASFGHRRRPQRHLARKVLYWLPSLAVVVAVLSFLVVTSGGINVRQSTPVLKTLDQFAARFGLGLDHVVLRGHKMTSDDSIFTQLDLSRARSLLGFDAHAARRRIEQLPWVRDVELSRTIPHRVNIVVRERRPFAVWQHDDKETLVDETGRHLARVAPGAVRSLPVVSGHGADQAAPTIINAISSWPDLVASLSLAAHVNARRWTLHLADQRKILLPGSEQELNAALRDLMNGRRGRRLFDLDFRVVDYRVPTQVTIRFRNDGQADNTMFEPDVVLRNDASFFAQRG
ncbi:MAG: cell division protein FtsQ/DivIB, partial [Hyphomicrobiaceae bacterium]